MQTSDQNETPLSRFRESLNTADVTSDLSKGWVGASAKVSGPYGSKGLIYVDYANSHTEASFCGGAMTRMRREAWVVIGQLCGCNDQHAVIFTGSGATAGLNRLVSLLGVADTLAAGGQVRFIIGPYEHHSNILPWRESGEEVGAGSLADSRQVLPERCRS